MNPIFFNLVKFAADNQAGESFEIALTLEGPFTIQAGIKPDICRAVVPYPEFDKLGGDLSVTGELRFFFTTDVFPDVVVSGVHIEEVEAVRWGAAHTAAGNVEAIRIVEYRLYFSDFRRSYISPRGGRLKQGLMNPSPQRTDATQAADAGGGAGAGDGGSAGGSGNGEETPLSNSELIGLCLRAMGLPGNNIDPAVNNIQPPMDLKWFGTHAPTELDKLLKYCNAVFCPHLDGSVTIELMGNGTAPTPPLMLPELPLGDLDHRGGKVVVTSYPTPVVNTVTLNGPNKNTFDYCVEDDTGTVVNGPPGPDGKPTQTVNDRGTKWVWLDESTAVADPLKAIHDPLNYIYFDRKAQDRIWHELYRCIRISPKICNALTSPVLSKVLNPDGSISELNFSARVAQKTKNGLWQDATDKVTVPIHKTFPPSGVIWLTRILGRVGNDNNMELGPLTKYFIPMSDGDATLTISFNPTRTDSDGNEAHQYFERGFTFAGNSVIGEAVNAMTDDETANALSDPDTIVICKPDYQLIQSNGFDQNRRQLEDDAQGVASLFFRRNASPRLVASKGFWGVNVSGVVQEVSIHQEEPKTILKVNTWFRPLNSFTTQEFADLEKEDAHPHQASRQADKSAMGVAGYNPPGQHANPPINYEDLPAGVYQTTGLDTGGGKYFGLDVTSPGTTKDTGDLSMPETGGSIGSTKVFIENIAENARKTHRLGSGKGPFFPSYVIGRRTGTQGDGTPIVQVDSCQCHPDDPTTNVGSTNSTSITAMTDSVEDADGKIVGLTLPTRLAVDSGTNTLYAMYRKGRLACGELADLSGETPVALGSLGGGGGGPTCPSDSNSYIIVWTNGVAACVQVGQCSY